MKSIARSEFAKLPTTKVKELMPILVTYNTEPFALVVDPEDVIFIGDLNIFVRQQLRAREQLARKGMPNQSPVKIILDEVKKQEKSEEPSKG